MRFALVITGTIPDGDPEDVSDALAHLERDAVAAAGNMGPMVGVAIPDIETTVLTDPEDDGLVHAAIHAAVVRV